MVDRDAELALWKTSVNLTEIAAAHGYVVDRRRSSRNSALMVRESDLDKIVVARGTDAHWVYFSVRDTADSGSVVDFLQRRGAGSIGSVRKLLRAWTGTSTPPPTRPPPSTFIEDLSPVSRNIAAVRAAFEGMPTLASKHSYLAGDRGLPTGVLESPRLARWIRVDQRGNAAFAHLNREGICGFELKNRGWTGFSKGGQKGLWVSGVAPTDDALWICESAIDALSVAALFGSDHGRFVSLAGQASQEQLELAASAMRKLPGGTVALAFDNDAAGDLLEQRLTSVFEGIGRRDLRLVSRRPPTRGMDWNDILRQQADGADLDLD